MGKGRHGMGYKNVCNLQRNVIRNYLPVVVCLASKKKTKRKYSCDTLSLASYLVCRMIIMT